jgi:hypothetical protein
MLPKHGKPRSGTNGAHSRVSKFLEVKFQEQETTERSEAVG